MKPAADLFHGLLQPAPILGGSAVDLPAQLKVELQQALVGKIGEYDQNILNVGMEIKAMEKVFQKVLPQFTENVNELSRVTQSIKKPKNAPG